MSLLQRLEIRQGQALVMTPQLLQAIKLLQLSQVDLAAYVDAELERNPLLERVEGEAEGERLPAEVPNESAVDRGGDGESEAYDGGEEPWIATTLTASGADMESALDTRLDNVFSDENPTHAREAASGDMLSLTPAPYGNTGGSFDGRPRISRRRSPPRRPCASISPRSSISPPAIPWTG